MPYRWKDGVYQGIYSRPIGGSCEGGMELALNDQNPKWRNIFSVSGIIALAMAGFHLYTAGFGLLTAMLQRGIHLYFSLVLILLFFPSRRKGMLGKAIDYSLILLTISVTAYMLAFATPSKLAARALVGLSNVDLLVGFVLIVLVLEVTRRICGMPMVVVGLMFLVYAFVGPYLPSLLAHKGYSFKQVIEQTVFTHEGIWGAPLAVSASFIVMFVIFGAILEKSGAGKFFIDIAFALTGRSRSGPAMAAVVSSGLMGSISGSSSANVVTTGAFTIPLMKKVGYKPHVAGAVEAAASTGGQIMPPVMGAAAFIMAEMMGIPYNRVVLAALIPATLYFVSIGFMVHLEALKLGLKGIPRDDLPTIKGTLKEGWPFLIPVVVLIYLLIIIAYSPTKSALYTVFLTILVGVLRKKDRMTLMDILDAFILGVRNTLVVAAACAAAGIVIGIMMMTGLGLRFSNLIATLSSGSLLLALILTALTCIILGMGLPTSAAYIVTATMGVPALVRLGLDPMAANMFIFYFACVSDITPPVAISGYAAAGVAASEPMITSLTASRFGLVAYVVPFMFAYGPALLLNGTPMGILQALFTALIGTWLIACGLQRWFLVRAGFLESALFIAAALLLINTKHTTDLLGFVLAAIVVAFHWYRSRTQRQMEGSEGGLLNETIRNKH